MADQIENSGSDFEITTLDFLPQNSNIKPALDSIYAEIEKSLPTIDFEISDVSSEEDIPIFHRALQTPTDDDGEESDHQSTSVFDEEEEDTVPNLEQLKFVDPHLTSLHLELGEQRHETSDKNYPSPQTKEDNNCRSVGTSANLNDFRGEVGRCRRHDAHPRSPIRDNWVPHERGEDSKIHNIHGTTSEVSDQDSRMKIHTKDVNKEDNIEEVVSRYLPAKPPTLVIENIDIDDVISGTLGRILDGTTSLPRNSNAALPMEKEEPSLIQKLAHLSVEQSGTSLTEVDPCTGALRKTGGLKDIKTAVNISVSSKGLGRHTETPPKIVTSDIINLPTSKLAPSPPTHKKKEPETVYLDLRKFDENVKEQKQSIKRVQRVLGITHRRDDSSSDEEDAHSWIEQRQRIKQSLQETGSLPEELLPKPKAAQSTASPKPRTQAQKLAPCFRVPPPSKDPVIVPTTPKSVSSTVDTEKEKAEKLAASRKLQEQRQRERQSRLRLGHCLEAVRPTLSDKGHAKCAEATPTLFDIDVSYEPAPQALPHELISSDLELVLLSVRLSSNGEIGVHRGASHKSVDKGAGLSASYTALIAWLLSLVPNNFDFLKTPPTEQAACPVPFYVIGLQQMVLDGEFKLCIAVVPAEKFTQKDAPGKSKSKSRKRDEIKDSSPFQQILTKFFAVNTLNNVCPWLQDLISMQFTKSNQSDSSATFLYRPPLPYITKRPLSTFIQVNPDNLAASKIFQKPIGFFWQTVESEEKLLDLNLNNEGLSFDIQNTMSLIYKKVYRDPRSMMGILNRILQEGLDLAGLRLLYPTPELLSIATKNPGLPQIDSQLDSTALEVLNHIGPIVSLAIRGTYARSIWLDAVGPSDPVLARKTDPNSLCALYGGKSRDECLLFCPRNPDRIHSELCRWFGGRVPASGVVNVGSTSNEFMVSEKRLKKKDSTGQKEKDALPMQPVATLTATTRSDLIIVISPLIQTKCLGLIIATCQKRGYQLHGVKRCRLSPKRAINIGLSSLSVPVFTNQPFSDKTCSGNYHVILAHGPVTYLLLNKENAFHTGASLIEAFMVQMTLEGSLADIAEYLATKANNLEITSSLLFHMIPYSDNMLSVIGNLSKIPHTDLNTTPGYITPRLHTNPELEQIVVLTLTGHQLLKTFGLFLGQILGVIPYCKSECPAFKHGMELLGIKWLPSLSLQHAKELTPYEVGEPAWKPSLQKLTSEPAVVLVLRAVNAYKKLESFLASHINCPSSYHLQQTPFTLETIMSLTPETAYRQATLFFHKWELYPDPSTRILLKYLPPLRQKQQAPTDDSVSTNKTDIYEESIFETMLSGPRPIMTFLLCKPNVIGHHLAKLTRRLTQEGFTIVGMRLMTLDKKQALLTVPLEDKKNEVLCDMHVDFLTSAPSLVLCVLRENAVKKLIDLTGPSDPKKARSLASGLWRGIFGTDPIINGLYCSSSYEDAIKELKIFFPEGLCCKQTEDLHAEQIPCPCADSIANLADYHHRVILTGIQKQTEEGQEPITKSSGTTAKDYVLPVTPLTQTNCIILTPALFANQTRSKKLAFVEVLDHLLNKGFHFVGARMLWLTEEQAQNCLHINDAGSFALVPLLTSGPSLVIAVQRDNAVMAFDSLLGSIYEKDSIYSKYGKHILQPKDCTHANRLLCYFFNELIPASHAKIVTKPSTD